MSLRDIPLAGGPPSPDLPPLSKGGGPLGVEVFMPLAAVDSVTLTPHKCGMLRLLQIAEITKISAIFVINVQPADALER